MRLVINLYGKYQIAKGLQVYKNSICSYFTPLEGY